MKKRGSDALTCPSQWESSPIIFTISRIRKKPQRQRIERGSSSAAIQTKGVRRLRTQQRGM
jgi:hypothetical protein